MAITQEELARRIRAAREACRMTQDEVASALGLSRSSVVQIEAANRSVSSLELDRLAHLFGKAIGEFLAETFREDDTLGALFRSETAVTADPEVLPRLRACLTLARELVNLERLVGVDRGPSAAARYPVLTPKSRWEAIQQGVRLAEDERRRLGLGDNPVPDLVGLFETQGVRTAIVDLPDDISGITLTEVSVGLFVVVNRGHHLLRRRFSLAHEYGHILVDRDRLALVSRGSERDDLVEVRANAFAASFLMPESGIRQFVVGLGKGKPSRVHAEVFDEAGALDVEGRTEPGTQALQLYDVVQVAHHFGVSRPAALYRLRNLRLLSEAEFEMLKALDEAGKGKEMVGLLGLPEPSHEEARNTFRRRFLGLALEAYRRDEITRAKLVELADLVGLSREDTARLVEDAGLNDREGADVRIPSEGS